MAVIYLGQSLRERMVAIMARQQAEQEEERAAYAAQWRNCPHRAGSVHYPRCDEAQGECRGGCVEMRARGLLDNGAAMERRYRPACGAKTRAGGECKVKVEAGKLRCRFHGGLSTGPKTQEGRARIAEAQRRRWQAFRDARAKVKADAKAARRAAAIARMG